eukprot:549214_1
MLIQDLLHQIVVVVLTLKFESFNILSWISFSFMLLIGFKSLDWFISAKLIWNGGFPFKFPLIPSNKILTDKELGLSDFIFTTINRCIITPIYVYHSTIYIRDSNDINYGFYTSITEFILSIFQFFALFAIYDLIYVTFHRTLHLPSIYSYIHKHHHKQISPFRGSYDGINTHPFEYLVGIYLHFWSIIILIFICNNLIGYKIYWLSIQLFLTLTALMAPLNHTRFAINIPYIYDTTAHDVHHRQPRSNYGQFVMWWDKIFGSYISFDDLNNRKTKKN